MWTSISLYRSMARGLCLLIGDDVHRSATAVLALQKVHHKHEDETKGLNQCEDDEPCKALTKNATLIVFVRRIAFMNSLGTNPIESIWENDGSFCCKLPNRSHYHIKDCEDVLIGDLFPSQQQLVYA